MNSDLAMRRYTFKLYPNAGQEAAFRQQAAMLAQLWNALLDMRETFYRRAKQSGAKKTSLSAFDQGKDLTELRAECPEWAAIPRGTAERVADMLDLAMKAFFKRAKAGAGGASGYPKFKSTRRADSIPLREPVKSCWKFSPVGNRWAFSMREIPGAVKARGKFPADPASLKTADIKFFDGAWWLSVCVAIAPRMTAGAEKFNIRLDLIDEFAEVKSANGQCVPGLSNPFSTGGKGEFLQSGKGLSKGSCGESAFAGEAQEADQSAGRACSCGESAFAGEAQGHCACGEPADLQSKSDRRFKKFSFRWKAAKRQIAHIQARAARKRNYDLHLWSTKIVRMARDIDVTSPPIKENTKSGRGDAARHGAEVETIAAINKRVLGMAPASAIAMLEYKSREAGIRCDVTRPKDHEIRVGNELKAVAIESRKARRIIKKELAYV